ncbi:MAG: signal peptidase I [Patescibacteria group bacterium]
MKYLIIFVSFVLFAAVGIYKFDTFVINGASMEPTLQKGDLIVTKIYSTYDVDDVVTYNLYSGTSLITHRIVSKEVFKDKNLYKTKGDNNNVEDPFYIADYEIVGKVLFAFPYLGALITFIFKPLTLLVLFYVPLGIILGYKLAEIKG